MQGAGRSALLDKDRPRLLPQKKRTGPRHGIRGSGGASPQIGGKARCIFCHNCPLGRAAAGYGFGLLLVSAFICFAARFACSPARRAAWSYMNSIIVYEVATGETALVNPDYILEAQVPYHSTVLYMLGMIFGVLLVALLFKR